MKISQAVEIWLEYHRLHSKKNTVKLYEAILSKIQKPSGGQLSISITSPEVLVTTTSCS